MSNKRILCFGDSLTWGWVPTPDGAPTTRYPFEQRWTGAMAAMLGDGFEIVEEGLSARTTNVDDPVDPRLNGSKHLPSALASHFPLDLVIIMLGTNDSKSYFRRTPYEIANGLSQLVGQTLTSAGGVGTVYGAPQVLVVAPPTLGELKHPWFEGMFDGGHEKTAALAHHYAALASFFGVGFLDAGQVISTDGCDGIHFTVQNNLELGAAVGRKVTEMFARD